MSFCIISSSSDIDLDMYVRILILAYTNEWIQKAFIYLYSNISLYKFNLSGFSNRFL